MSEGIKNLFCRAVYERAVLSYCFKSSDNYYTIASMVSGEDFLSPDHKLIFTILGTLIKRGVSSFDGALVINEAKTDGVLKQIGGYDYVDAVIGTNVSDGNLEYYIKKLLDASTKYKLYNRLKKHSHKLEDKAQDEDMTSDNLMNAIESDIMDLSMQSKFVKEPKNLADGLDEYIEERRKNPIEYCGIGSGFPIVDKRIDGLVPGTLHVICARPKEGKSTFLSCVSSYVAYNLRKPVLYVDTEMPFEQWRDRIIAMLSGVPERRVKHGGYSDDEYERIIKAKILIEGSKLFHEFMPGYDVDKLISVYKKYKYKEDIGLAVFDYIKAPSGSDFQNKKEYQIIGDVTTALKDLSGELNIPVIAANQINRQEDIADSDRVLRYADVIAFFRRRTSEEMQDIENKYSPFHNDYGTYKLWIKESRRGGHTPPEGIGFSFKKRMLLVHEAKRQLIDYDSPEYNEKEEVINEHSISDATDNPAENADGRSYF
jgi:replicative DNA helicase